MNKGTRIPFFKKNVLRRCGPDGRHSWKYIGRFVTSGHKAEGKRVMGPARGEGEYWCYQGELRPNSVFIAVLGLREHYCLMEDRIRRQPAQADKTIFDDGEALISMATASFKKAAKAAVAENDRLGIRTHGSVEGKLVERKPNAKPRLIDRS